MQFWDRITRFNHDTGAKEIVSAIHIAQEMNHNESHDLYRA